MILIVFVLLRRDVVCDRVAQLHGRRWLAIVREGECEVERERILEALQLAEGQFGLAKLLFRQARDCSADRASLRLQPPDIHDLLFRFGLGSGAEIRSDAFAGDPAVNAKNDLPGGIREL